MRLSALPRPSLPGEARGVQHPVFLAEIDEAEFREVAEHLGDQVWRNRPDFITDDPRYLGHCAFPIAQVHHLRKAVHEPRIQRCVTWAEGNGLVLHIDQAWPGALR